MIDAMRAFFERFVLHWERETGGLPRASWDEDVDPSFWAGPPDEDEWAPWRPVPKTSVHDLDAIAAELSPWPASIQTYVNSYWFAPFDGGIDGRQFTFVGVLPGEDVDEIVSTAVGYAESRGVRRIPIGVDFDGLQLVVDAVDGRVVLDDWDRGELIAVADDLEDLFLRLEP